MLWPVGVCPGAKMRGAGAVFVSIGLFELVSACGGYTSDSSESAPVDSSSPLFAPARKLETAPDPFGVSASYSDRAFDAGATNAFFTALGPNGRSCETCRRQEAGWTISGSETEELARTSPHDPLFAPVDGSDCPPTSPQQQPDAANSSLAVSS